MYNLVIYKNNTISVWQKYNSLQALYLYLPPRHSQSDAKPPEAQLYCRSQGVSKVCFLRRFSLQYFVDLMYGNNP